jgi:hypothetical protein
LAIISNSIIPPEVRGSVNSVLDSDNNWRYWYPWLENLKNTNVFVHLSAVWQNKNWTKNPDPGFDYYVLSGDSGMTGWAEHVADIYHRPVFVISLPEVYGDSANDLVTYIPNIYYHRQISKLMDLSSGLAQKNIQYKASALTSRITQSKVIVFAALKRWLDPDCVFSLHDRFEPGNVHHWALTNNPVLDDLTDYFRKNWLLKSIKIPGDDNEPLSTQNPAYIQSAINFTQESFHYSLMHDSVSGQEHILPGPFLTEKTFKCLLSQTAFVPVGQFRSYRWLETMGMKFNYGLDLSFDDDSGNISRLHKLVDFIQDLSRYTAQELFEMTLESSQHNRSIIVSGEFFDKCEKDNQSSMIPLYEHVLG